ncbi:AIM2 [Acrasis kona]|uniref:AIM2 n=1 Tax=Acrasis kona TaxID=1008807 RepID=A0AAW2YHP6_9EUKA
MTEADEPVIPLCDNCVSGYVHQGTTVGTEQKIGDLDCYVSFPSTKSKAKTIVFLHDMFGWKFINNRLLADQYASNGFYVVMPDLFVGDVVPDDLADKLHPERPSELSLVKKTVNKCSAMMFGTGLLFRHRDVVTRPIINKFIGDFKSNEPGVGSIGVVGFCWGGRHAALLGSNEHVTSVFLCHPSMISFPSEIEQITKPVGIGAAEKDAMFPKARCDKSEEIFRRKNLKHDVKVYTNVEHGWSVRADLNNHDSVVKKEEIAKQVIDWFKSTL